MIARAEMVTFDVPFFQSLYMSVQVALDGVAERGRITRHRIHDRTGLMRRSISTTGRQKWNGAGAGIQTCFRPQCRAEFRLYRGAAPPASAETLPDAFCSACRRAGGGPPASVPSTPLSVVDAR